jgi:hypothetical protein
MGSEFGIVYPLWHYAADGEEFLDRLVGEVGIGHVVVPAVTGAVEQFRYGLETDAPYFHTPGGWHFPPAARLYGAAGARPVKARWFGHHDVFGRLREQLQRLGIELVVRVDLPNLRALVDSEPHLAQRNAWGQPMPPVGLCWSHPAARELLRATLEDLQRYGPIGVQLVPAPSYRDPDALSRSVGLLGLNLEGELGTCFCPACRQIAERDGLDAEAAARSVRVRTAREAAHPSGTLVDGLASDEWDDFIAAQADDFAIWLDHLAETDKRWWYELVLRPDIIATKDDSSSLRQVVQWQLDFAVDEEQAKYMLQVGRNCREAWSLPAWRPAFETGDQLVRIVRDAAGAGLARFDFEQVTASPPEVVTWLKQAVRFARRE